MPSEHLYLDHNATTPLLPEVAAAMAECAAAGYGNPASQHAAGRRARQVIEDARETIGRILGADVDTHRGDRILFTSGATEANNLALRGLNASGSAPVYVSAIEHPSVAGVAAELRRRGERVVTLPVTRDGVLDLAAAEELIQPGGRLVAVMYGNNDTGILQPIVELAALCRVRNVPLFTDAVQAVGKIDVDFRSLGVAALSASAHKFHGPAGIGVLLVRPETALEPLLFGGFQQGGLRPGTESVALAVGMSRALECWHNECESRQKRMAELRDRFESGLRENWPDVVVQGEAVVRLPHTTCASFVGLERQALMLALDLAGVACSTGSACASGSSEPSPALVAAGCEEPLLASALRFSVGATSTAAEIELALAKIGQVCGHLQGQTAAEIRPSTLAGRPAIRYNAAAFLKRFFWVRRGLRIAPHTWSLRGAIRRSIQACEPCRNRRLKSGAWDGPAVTNGVLRIPLSGRASGAVASRGRSRAAAMRPFVAGDENLVAAVAVLATLDPARTPYNPLVFCGAPGLGKSHLLGGLVAEYQSKLPAAQVVHIVAVDFAREYAEAIDVQSLDEFRPRYRDARLLAMEDLHLIAGKNAAQAELARTIDAVRDAGGTVLVSMRHRPADTQGILPTLAARLDAGLVVTLAPPDEAARRELLVDLAAERGVQLSDEARDLLVRQLDSTPRELEAAMVQLSALGQEQLLAAEGVISEALVRTLLDSRAEATPLAIDSLARASAKYFAERLELVRGPSRRRGLALARSVGMFLARRLSGLSLSEIGRYYGGRDHTTVLHACNRIESELTHDRALVEATHEIRKLARRDQWHKQNQKAGNQD